MTTQEASKILKMLLGYLKGEIEPPSPKTLEEAEKFEQEGYECLEIAIRSLEAWEKVKEDFIEETKCPYVWKLCETDGRDICAFKLCYLNKEEIFRIIDKHLQEVEEA